MTLWLYFGGTSRHKYRINYYPEEDDTELKDFRVIHDTGGQFSIGDVTDRPSPTIDTNPRLFIEFFERERETCRC